jgi:hypothetical protein
MRQSILDGLPEVQDKLDPLVREAIERLCIV